MEQCGIGKEAIIVVISKVVQQMVSGQARSFSASSALSPSSASPSPLKPTPASLSGSASAVGASSPVAKDSFGNDQDLVEELKELEKGQLTGDIEFDKEPRESVRVLVFACFGSLMTKQLVGRYKLVWSGGTVQSGWVSLCEVAHA